MALLPEVHEHRSAHNVDSLLGLAAGPRVSGLTNSRGSIMRSARFDNLSDLELIEICNSGPRDDAVEAFGLLYRRHRDYVTRIALRFSSDREIAADTLQDTFIYLLRKFPPSDEGLTLTARLRSLLYPVAKNLTLTRRSGDAAGMKDPQALDPDQLPDPQSVNPPQENLAAVMAGLSSRHREVCCCDSLTACE